MTGFRIRLAMLLLFVAALAWPRTSGASQPGVPISEKQIAEKAGCAQAKAGNAAGVARWLEDCGAVNPQATPESAARSVIAARAPQLGLRADGRDLALLKSDKTNAANYVRFQQTHNGVPVFQGQVLVQYDRAGKVQLINNHTLPNLAVKTTPAVAAAPALAAAKAEIAGADQLRHPAEQQLEIYAHNGTPQLAWHVMLATRQPRGDWHVMISAQTGKILSSWDAIVYDTGSGHAYDPNPIQTTGTTTLTDNDDATSTALNNARVNFTLNNLNSGVQTLEGAYVDVTGTGIDQSDQGCDLPYIPGTATSATRTYNYDRDDNRFEEVVAYTAIDGAQTWFQALGFNNVNNRSIPIDVHCDDEDNSSFSSADDALRMGDGGVDDGEDADIVIHEYGHSVHHNQVPGWGGGGNNNEQRAMGEGFGDFLAGMYYINKGNPTFMNTYRYCIGEWDAASYNPITPGNPGSGCLRWIDGRSQSTGADIGVYSGTPTQVHADGLFWSASLTCVYEGLGANTQARDDIIQIVLESHFSLTPDNSTNAFEDAVAALITADETHNSGANKNLITDCALERGLIVLPKIIAPSFSAPTDGGSYQADTPLEITWLTDSAPTTATYTLEYTNDCTPSIRYSDTVESGTNGWAVAHDTGTLDWARVTDDSHSPSTSWFASDIGSVNDQYLVSPNLSVGANQQLSFWHSYDMEDGYDGGVIEISTNITPTWQNLGGRITQNGYNGSISPSYDNPIRGRAAFTGDSGGWIETLVDLSTYAGQTVQIRFRQGDDSEFGAVGWWIDDISIKKQVSWTMIGTTAPGASSYSWTTPIYNGTDYCIRIHGQAEGFTDSNYDIVGPFSLTGGTNPIAAQIFLPFTRR